MASIPVSKIFFDTSTDKGTNGQQSLQCYDSNLYFNSKLIETDGQDEWSYVPGTSNIKNNNTGTVYVQNGLTFKDYGQLPPAGSGLQYWASTGSNLYFNGNMIESNSTIANGWIHATSQLVTVNEVEFVGIDHPNPTHTLEVGSNVYISNTAVYPAATINCIGLTNSTQFRVTDNVFFTNNVSIPAGDSRIAIGKAAGQIGQGISAVAIGDQACVNGQNNYSVAIGQYAGSTGQGIASTAIGQYAGQDGQGADAVAIGKATGQTGQGASAVAIGDQAGVNGQNNYSVAIGQYAGQNGQHSNCIAIGHVAGQNDQGRDAIAIGNGAGSNTGENCIHVGRFSGGGGSAGGCIGIGHATQVGDGGLTPHQYAIAIGESAGWKDQNSFSTAIGYTAGKLIQGQNCIAIGKEAGYENQCLLVGGGIAIGLEAGKTNQEQHCVAIGSEAGYNNQGTTSVAVGYHAGQNDQVDHGIAIGSRAGETSQGKFSIAIGYNSSNINGGDFSIALGSQAGLHGLGTNSIAIGKNADNISGTKNDNTIVINASGNNRPTTVGNALFIDPIRVTEGAENDQQLMHYDSTSKEVYVDRLRWKFNVIDPTSIPTVLDKNSASLQIVDWVSAGSATGNHEITLPLSSTLSLGSYFSIKNLANATTGTQTTLISVGDPSSETFDGSGSSIELDCSVRSNQGGGGSSAEVVCIGTGRWIIHQAYNQNFNDN